MSLFLSQLEVTAAWPFLISRCKLKSMQWPRDVFRPLARESWRVSASALHPEWTDSGPGLSGELEEPRDSRFTEAWMEHSGARVVCRLGTDSNTSKRLRLHKGQHFPEEGLWKGHSLTRRWRRQCLSPSLGGLVLCSALVRRDEHKGGTASARRVCGEQGCGQGHRSALSGLQSWSPSQLLM